MPAMVQFKKVFTGARNFAFTRAAKRAQKASAPGGKHNEPRQVGLTPRATTPLLEMLGNLFVRRLCKEERAIV